LRRRAAEAQRSVSSFNAERGMKLNSIHQTRILWVLVASLLCPVFAGAQVKRLTDPDKTQIIQSILRRYDFAQSETWNDNSQNTVYLLSENISPADVPSLKGVTFTIVEPDQIDRLKKTGIEYYRFTRFEIGKTAVRISFIRTYTSAREGNGSVMEYTCRKVSGRWKLKARLDGVYAS
jgi:hypothetical protein